MLSSNFKIVLTQVFGIALFCLIADYLMLVKPFGSNSFWGIYDNVIHAFVCLLVLLPFARREYLFKDIILFLAIGSLIDIDHFVMAGSFSVSDVIKLTMRPPTHSFTFIFLLTLITFPFHRRLAILFFLGLSSHILRDASSGITPMFYPLEFYKVPYSLYVFLECLLVMISILLASKIVLRKKRFQS